MLHTCHIPAALGTFLTHLDAFLHIADLLAVRRTGLADLGAQPAQAMRKRRAAELEIRRCLADLGAAHQQPEVLWFDVLAASLEAVVHRGLQADLIAPGAGINAGLHGVFSMG